MTKQLSGRASGIIGLLNMATFVILGTILLRKWQLQLRTLEPDGETGSIGAQPQLLKRLRRKRILTLVRICLVPIGVGFVIAGEPTPSLAAQIAVYGFIILFMAFLCYRWWSITKSIHHIQETLKQSELGETQ